MAGRTKFTRDDVIDQVLNEGRPNKRKLEDRDKVKRALVGLAVESELDSHLFVSAGLNVLMPLYAVCKSQHCAADILAKWNVSTPAIFQSEARLWLTNINRHLGGRRRIRNPFFGEISRDIPFELFSVVVKLVKATPTYCEPFCYYSNNKKGEVISFTSLRLVVELLSLLSGYTEEEVVKYFKRNLTAGSRRGHNISVICSDVKDFAFVYKHRQGKLVISFNFGEWNVSGFPQHI